MKCNASCAQRLPQRGDMAYAAAPALASSSRRLCSDNNNKRQSHAHILENIWLELYLTLPAKIKQKHGGIKRADVM